MSERTETSVVKVGDFPSYLADMTEPDESLANASEHRTVPRISIIQGLTPKEKRGGNQIGSAILSPGGALFMMENETCLFTPLFLYTEFIQYRDRDDTSDSMVIARSFDPTSMFARKARDKDARREGYGSPDSKGNPRFYYQYVEARQFVVQIRTGRCAGEVCNLNFHKGEMYNGDAFCSLLMQRKVEIDGRLRHVPSWMQVYEMTLSTHKNRKGNEWFGFDVANPPQGANPFIANEECPDYKKAFDELNEKFKLGLLSSDDGLGQESEAVADNATANPHGM